jgi:hypothetical protein
MRAEIRTVARLAASVGAIASAAVYSELRASKDAAIDPPAAGIAIVLAMKRLATPAVVAAVAMAAAAFAGAAPSDTRGAHAVDALLTGPLATALVSDSEFNGGEAPAALNHARRTGATAAVLTLYWKDVAPAGPKKPSFDASDPGSDAYDWSKFDTLVKRTVAAKLEPIVIINSAPRWAERSSGGPVGTNDPDPAELAKFAHAAASRYSGTFNGLPRIRNWQVWNEPNISLYLTPQFNGRTPVSPANYRAIVNAAADAIHAAAAGNVVIAGGTAPFRDITPSVLAVDSDWGPLAFMRNLLCVSKSLKPTCHDTIKFDVWAHHPYTSGGPTHHAILPNDVSLADLPEMREVLSAALAHGTIQSSRSVRFWVTEFSWDSDPPDPQGVPMPLLVRWIPHALYEMWRSGVSLVAWFGIRDHPLTEDFFQSGLYYRGDTLAEDSPKPLLEAFRFPVVAFPRSGRVYVWGRTPLGNRAAVVVQQCVGSRCRTIGRVRPNGDGIFEKTFGVASRGSIRGRLAHGETSAAFSLKAVRDRFFNPFGQTTLLESKKKKTK